MKRLGLLLLILPFVAAAEVVVPIDSVEQHVNIRMSADAKSEIVGKLNQGDAAKLVSSSPGWHEVEIAGGATGFISADWTRVLVEAPVAKVTPLKVESEKVTAADVAALDNVAAEAEATIDNDVAQVTDKAMAAGDSSARDAVDKATAAEKAIANVVDEKDFVAESVYEVVAEIESAPVVAADVNDTVASAGKTDDVAGDIAETTKATKVAAVTDVKPAAENSAQKSSHDANAADHSSVATATIKPAPSETVSAPSTARIATAGIAGPPGPRGETGPPGPQGPAGPPGAGKGATIEGSVNFLAKFSAPTIATNSQVFDDGNKIGIGTTAPKQRLEVNGNIQIHERNSSVAGLMITQSDGETGYIMHNRASTLTIGAGSVDRITIDRQGNVGFGVAKPTSPIELASGAHVSAGGVWTNSSSRARKENISALALGDALETLAQLEPVQFNYKNDQTENYVGFIAEDVPDLVATSARDALSPMDIVAVLTKVVQEQQKKIAELEARLDQR